MKIIRFYTIYFEHCMAFYQESNVIIHNFLPTLNVRNPRTKSFLTSLLSKVGFPNVKTLKNVLKKYVFIKNKVFK